MAREINELETLAPKIIVGFQTPLSLLGDSSRSWYGRITSFLYGVILMLFLRSRYVHVWVKIYSPQDPEVPHVIVDPSKGEELVELCDPYALPARATCTYTIHTNHHRTMFYPATMTPWPTLLKRWVTGRDLELCGTCATIVAGVIYDHTDQCPENRCTSITPEGVQRWIEGTYPAATARQHGIWGVSYHSEHEVHRVARNSTSTH